MIPPAYGQGGPGEVVIIGGGILAIPEGLLLLIAVVVIIVLVIGIFGEFLDWLRRRAPSLPLPRICLLLMQVDLGQTVGLECHYRCPDGTQYNFLLKRLNEKTGLGLDACPPAIKIT